MFLKNVEFVYILNYKVDFFGIFGEFMIDYGKVFDCSCVVVDGCVKGIYFLMKKNKVIEYDGCGIFIGLKVILVVKFDGLIEEVMFDNVIIVMGFKVWLFFGV